VEQSFSQNGEVSELQRQNEELRRVIRHMRRDIETLGSQQPSSTVPSDQLPAAVNSPPTAVTDGGPS